MFDSKTSRVMIMIHGVIKKPRMIFVKPLCGLQPASAVG